MSTRRRVAVGIALGLVWVLLVVAGRSLGPGLDPDAVAVATFDPERVALWEMVAECESGSRWDLASGNGFFGGLQFTRESWAGVGGEGLPSDATRAEQIYRAELLYELQGWGAWPGCSARLGLR